MQWDELNAERGLWTLPGNRTKNGRQHVLPLPAAAWSLIESVPRTGRFLFARRSGFSAWGAAKQALDARLKLAHWEFSNHSALCFIAQMSAMDIERARQRFGILRGASLSASIGQIHSVNLALTGRVLTRICKISASASMSRSSCCCIWPARASPIRTVASHRSPSVAKCPDRRLIVAKGKSIADDLISGLESVTKTWAKQRKAEERNTRAIENRAIRMMRSFRTTQKEVVVDNMEEAYLKASAGGTLPANCRQIYYAIRPIVQQEADTKEQLSYSYFQTLLAEYVNEHGPAWDSASHTLVA
jgi:hypothetical protein